MLFELCLISLYARIDYNDMKKDKSIENSHPFILILSFESWFAVLISINKISFRELSFAYICFIHMGRLFIYFLGCK